MARIRFQDSSGPAAERPFKVSQSTGSFLISLAFWLTLVLASCQYAAVALSPKLADWMLAREQFAANAAKLRQLEEEVDYLERVTSALRSDPEFARRLVSTTERLSGPDDKEFLRVAPELMFGETVPAPSPRKSVFNPAVSSLVLNVAGNQRLRTWLLASAAGLTLLAFTFLNESGAGIAAALFESLRRAGATCIRRYRKAPPAENSLRDEGCDESVPAASRRHG